MKETVAQDGTQDLDISQSGGISKGVPAEDNAVYQPAPATVSEADETDAAPAKPPPMIPQQAVVPPIMPQALPQVAGRKRFREDTAGSDPFIAIKVDKKKSKPAPPTEDEDTQEEEEFDLTGGEKREGEDPLLGPERRDDVELQDVKPQMYKSPEETTQAPLGAGGAE